MATKPLSSEKKKNPWTKIREILVSIQEVIPFILLLGKGSKKP